VSIQAVGQVESALPRERKNNIQLNFGFIHSRLIDNGYSKNLLFRGTNSKLTLRYGRETRTSIFHFSAGGSVGKIASKNSKLPSDFYTLQPSLEYLGKIRDHQLLGKQNSFFAGASLSSMNYFAINEPIFDNASLLSLHGIYFSVSNRLHLGEKRSLQLTYRLPLAVYVNRLLWNGGASDLNYTNQEHLIRTLTTNGSFRYFDVFNNVQINATYTRRLGANAEFLVTYEFRYFSRDADPSAHIYSNELLFGLKIIF
jgi:hypothetical protein